MASREREKREAREARVAAEEAAGAGAVRRKRLITFGAILGVAAVVVLVAVLVSQSGKEDAPTQSEQAALFEGIPQDRAWLGRPDAPVVVEEYVDLQCPFCAQFSTRQLPAIVRDFVRPGDVRMRARVLTFLGPESVTAGRTAAAAGLQDRQWNFMEAFYAKQGAENSGYVTDDFLREVGEDAGIDVDRALDEREDPAVLRQLRVDAVGAQRGGVQSTPTFLVGRRGGDMKAVGADELPAAIEAAVGNAR